MNDDITPEITMENVAKMIDIAIFKSETRVLTRVRDAIIANNAKLSEQLTEQLTELGVINQE